LRWHELHPWVKDIAFIGFPEEHRAFQKLTGMNVELYSPTSYVDICRVLLGSDLFVGNQSFVYSLAEALKVNRVQETCLLCPNCLPHSDNGFCSLTQAIIRHFVLREGPLPHGVRKVHSLSLVCNRLTGSAIPKPMKLQVPLYGRSVVACVVIGGKGREAHYNAMLANLPAKEIICLDATASAREITEAISKTTAELICFMDDKVKLTGTWLLDLCGMTTSDIGVVGQHIDPLPIPHARGLLLVNRKIFCDCGSLPDAPDRWLAYASILKEHGYITRQARSGNIILGGA
jgi:hypothetical protein